ncbi:MAG: putative bifunctional diguanylate cyclase/phosphodiesterase, partial [Rhodospirillaceae bacterium]
VAVLFIDLDHFKNVNDSYGHSIGDKLLRKAAERILACIRETDTLSRLGGDEFVVLLVHEGNERDDATVADRILKALRAPFSIEGRDIRIGASMGITVYPEDATDPEDLIRNADTAMYQAKTHGRNAFTFFTKELDQTIQAQIQLEGELRQAVAEMNLAVYYQPFVDSRALTIMGAEALIRWPNQNRGFVPPSKFIPIAEELGLIDEIGSWVLFAACSQAKIWQDKLHPRFRIAVNCSGRQILQKGFPDQVREVLTGSGLPGELLELEISESVLMRDSDAMGPNLRALADLGVRLAVDNFGTSHASIKHLRDHPFTILKLDRSCVSDVLHRAEDALLVETAITMARRMGLSVVAEGVESEDQLSFLQEHYCDVIQGYLFGQPLPPDEFMRML